MPVNSTHPEYSRACRRWALTRSIVDNDAKHLIREVDPNDPKRTKQYRDDAILTNFTRLTQEGLCGLVFKKHTKIEVPTELTYLLDDSTGYGFGLEQLSQKILKEILVTGRYGLLVDYPQETDGESLARIRPYNAESIINWRYQDYGNQYQLQMVVLKEDVDDVGEDGFEWNQKCQYRVLFLDANRNYTQAIYNEDLELVSIIVPADYNGQPLKVIPFTFIGSENNDAWIDNIPLYDLAVLNLGHYRNSADLEETSFIAGQLVPVIQLGETGIDEFNQANPGGIQIGSRKGLTVGSGGDFKFAQGDPNLVPRQLQIDKQEQAAAIGARLIAPPGGRETAEGARIRYGSQNSALYNITKNMSRGFEDLLWWAAVYMMESPKESVFELNDQFYEENADPNLIAQQIMLFDRGMMSSDEIRDNLKRSGMHLKDQSPEPGNLMQFMENDEPQE